MNIPRKLINYNNKLEKRSLNDINTLVIHCTELPNTEMAREFAEGIHYDSGTGNCGHYYIAKDGIISQWVEDTRIAHHVAGHNQYSIGIELENLGRFPYWLKTNYQIMYDPYPQSQIESLSTLIKGLESRLPKLTQIIGHEDLDKRFIPSENDPAIFIRRKVDPGLMFPWRDILNKTQLEYSGNYGKPYEPS